MTTRNLGTTRAQDASKLKVLRLQVNAGAEAIARGRYIEVDDGALEDFLDQIDMPTRRRTDK